VKCLITHSSVGACNGVALESLPSDSYVWADVAPLDVFKGAAGSVAEKRASANGGVAGRGVAKESERPVGGVTAACGIAQKRSGTSGRILVCGVEEERPRADTRAEVAVGEAQERIYTKRRVV